jgi:superfamily II DNA or RNA helicase
VSHERVNSTLQAPAGFTPRRWATQAHERFLQHEGTDFLVNACPGSGKTKFAAMVAREALQQGRVDRVDLVGPSSHICQQWLRELAGWGIHLDPENVRESADCQGRVMTYQRLGMSPESFRLCDARRTLVILDEIHHAGDARTWGDALRHAFQGATRRLLLSGTPFRSDNRQIPFVRYTHGHFGTSASDFTYGYGEALKDGYCAPIFFPHHDGEFTWERGGEEHRADFRQVLGGRASADRLRTALDPRGAYVGSLLEEAHRHLMDLRRKHPEAGGIVFGRDVANVRALAEVLTRITGRAPISVTTDDADAGARIRRFRAAGTPWIVSVKMVSEGVDIPRLRVGVFLSNIRTEMFFRQAAGRLVRLVPGLQDQAGYFYIPSLARLVRYAREMQTERRHAVGARKSTLLNSGHPAEERPREVEASDYRFLDSRGQQVGIIETGPAVEENGQGLLDFARDIAIQQARQRRERLLRQRRNQNPAPRQEPEMLHERKEQIRRKGGRISSLVREVHARHGVPYGQIHASLNRCQGVLSQQQCTLSQLEDRERLLEHWASQGRLGA